jgi:hypothetical protein
MASVRGRVRLTSSSRGNGPLESALVRLAPIDGAVPSIDAEVVSQGRFEFLDVPPGLYILSVLSVYRETVRAIHVVDGANEVGPVDVRFVMCDGGPVITCEAAPLPGSLPDFCVRATPVLTVCEALMGDLGARCNVGPVVIVGIFKSGMDDTLRLDCPFQLVTGEVGWPSSVGLNRPSMPPDVLRDRIETKRQEVLRSGPPGAQPRPERVVGLYGGFHSLADLTSAPCCSSAVETALPPARLFGIGEKDLGVIR